MKLKQKMIVVGAAVVAPSLLLMPGVVAGPSEGSMDDQAAQYREVRAAEVEAQEAGTANNKPTNFAPCVKGVAKGTDFACDKVQLLGHVPLAALGTTFGNDIWGWTAPDGEREWAIVGGAEGTAFVEVTDPKRPVVTGFLPTLGAFDRQSWRDMKTVNDHAFIVAEDTGSGMQVFDMTRLLDAEPDTQFDTDAVYSGTSSTHNIVSHEDSDTVYLVGSNVCSAGLHAVDVSDPTAPVFAGCFDDHGYVHDAQCVTYDGPDAEHDGKTICVSSVSNYDGQPYYRTELSIVDMTDPMAPQPLALVEYNDGGVGYSHQGWLTEDHSMYVHGDELDEYDAFPQSLVNEETSSWIFDLSDLDDPQIVEQVFHGTTSIDHNLFIDGRYIFAGNYTSGLRVFDTRELEDGEMPQAAFFDTYPENDAGTFEGGIWGTYPYFAQEDLVAVSTIDRGLFLLRPQVDTDS